jgi:polysaccharide pyruvyl transferase WcaK-like protein
VSSPGGTEARRIALMGPFGYGNLGDAAIVDAALATVRRCRPGWDVRGITLDPADTERRHGIPSVPLSRVTPTGGGATRRWDRWWARRRASPRRWVRSVERVVGRGPAELRMLVDAYRALDGVDALVACGSGQIQDRWGGGGPWSYPYVLLRWSLLARARGARVLVVSVGAGPVDAWLSRRFFRWALGLAAYRSYRDGWSRDFVADRIGLGRDDPVYPDLAFGLPALSRRRGTPRPSSPARRGRVVGVGPIGYQRPGNWPEADEQRYGGYLDTIADVVVRVLAVGDRVRFLKGEAHYDQLVVDDLVAELARRGVAVDGRALAGDEIDTVDDLVGALVDCDVVVTSRFHNVLIALAMGRPVVALSYQHKIDALMDEFELGELCLPLGAATPGAVLERLERTRSLTGFAERAAAVAERARRELDEQHERLLAVL